MAKKRFQQTKANIKKMWKAAKQQVEDVPDFLAALEDGRYLAQLTDYSIKDSATERAWHYMEWTWEVVEGDSEGENIYKRIGLETEDNLAFLIRDLNRLGVETDALEINDEDDLEEVTKELIEQKVQARLRLKTNDAGYQNVWIDKLIAKEGEESEEKEEIDYSEMSLGHLKKECKERDIDLPKKLNKKKLIALLEEEEPEEKADLVGKTMGFKKGKRMLVGKILSVDEDKGTFKMKTDIGKKVTGEIDDLEKSEEEEEEEEEEKTAEIEVGDDVVVDYKGKDVTAIVKSIDTDENEATVLLSKPKRKITVPLDEIYMEE